MIYCIEDDNGIHNLMIYTLKASGFDVTGFSEPAEFWNKIKTEKPELILLDIMLPDEDEISILKNYALT